MDSPGASRDERRRRCIFTGAGEGQISQVTEAEYERLLLEALRKLGEGEYELKLPPAPPGALGCVGTGIGRLAEVLHSRDANHRETEQLSMLLQEVNSQLDASRRQLARLADEDELTGLLNRRSFTAVLDGALLRARRAGQNFAVLFLDLDAFKAINDSHGHAAGDVVLQAVGERLQEVVRATDSCARLGGDEFAVLMSIADGDHLEVLGRRLLSAVRAPIRWEDSILSVGASIGLVVIHGEDESADALLDRADRAMYAAKESGGNRVQIIRFAS